MSNYDALASFLLLFIPLAAVVQLLNWWFCPLEAEHGKGVSNPAARLDPFE